MGCEMNITDAEKAKRYDLTMQLKETYSWSPFADKVGLLLDNDFSSDIVEYIVTTMKQDVERWSK